jgi:hypothetical protein
LIYKFHELDSEQRAQLVGYIAFVTGFEPEFKNSLIKKFGLPRISRVLNVS